MQALLLTALTLTACGSKVTGDSPTDYAGVYLDDNGTDNPLVITPDSTGGYHVSIAIYRLTMIDDGLGRATTDGLAFTATDANGQPIGGIITLSGDTATVTFTDSHWTYLPNGEQFRYYRSQATTGDPPTKLPVAPDTSALTE